MRPVYETHDNLLTLDYQFSSGPISQLIYPLYKSCISSIPTSTSSNSVAEIPYAKVTILSILSRVLCVVNISVTVQTGATSNMAESTLVATIFLFTMPGPPTRRVIWVRLLIMLLAF
ncbi:hypothetical protein GWI33_020529 [Rhynchophorus ferrugineus]|uniref:Uncharacterized protein n=1 Tax=Rhynchophorus ferrugineus TaxID=354439 RepID=A0A834M5T0_RHYFE|nr:hypothetical protein GWI33_020529 [Rhynchophorus ferrugineus]